MSFFSEFIFFCCGLWILSSTSFHVSFIWLKVYCLLKKNEKTMELSMRKVNSSIIIYFLFIYEAIHLKLQSAKIFINTVKCFCEIEEFEIYFFNTWYFLEIIKWKLLLFNIFCNFQIPGNTLQEANEISYSLNRKSPLSGVVK